MKRVRALFVLLLVVTGCAQLQKTVEPPVDVAEQRGQRREQLLADFEQRRSQAQLLAAQARFSEGDLDDCRLLLQQILDRQPDHREARRLLAELHLAQQRPAEAEQHLRLLVAQNAEDAEAHHALGLLLETHGRQQEAVAHFQRAAQLEPQNRLYALSAAGMVGTPGADG